MVYVFLIDNHPQSEARSEAGLSSSFTGLDLCKFAAETLEKALRRGHQALFEKGPQPEAQAQHPMEFCFMLVDSTGHKGCILTQASDPQPIFFERLRTMAAHVPTKDAPYDLSYALTQVMSILNKARMQHKVDTFGCGRSAAALEPVTLFLVTDAADARENGTTLTLDKSAPPTGSDFYSEPFRWDQRIFPIVVGPEDDSGLGAAAGSTIPADLRHLATVTGGQALVCRGLGNITESMKALAAKLLHASVVMRFSSKHFLLQGGVGATAGALSEPCKLCPIGKIRYPIPEAFYVENSMDVVPARAAHPTLTLIPEGKGASGSAELALARALGVHVDAYEIRRATDSPLSQTLSRLGLKKDELRMLYVAGSHRPTSDANDRDPFALIGPGKTAAGSPCTKLYVLPYNFPRLLPVLKEASDAQKNMEPGPGLAAGVTAKIRQALTTYLWALPGYNYPTLTTLCNQFHLGGIVQVPQMSIYSRGMERKLDRLVHMAGNDMENLGRSMRERWPQLPPDPFDMIQHQCFVAGKRGEWTKQDADFSLDFPRQVTELRTDVLLTAWENMHAKIYGGHSLVGHGVSIKRRRGSLGFSPAAHNGSSSTRAAVDQDWFAVGSGVTPVQSVAVSQMSSYMEHLCRKEALRDPSLDETPHADEDEPVGMFRRKVAVDFGNPYSKDSKKGSAAPRVPAGAPGGDLLGGFSGDGSREFEQVQKEADALFADTPIPEHTTFGDAAGATDAHVSPSGGGGGGAVVSIPRLSGGTVLRGSNKRKRGRGGAADLSVSASPSPAHSPSDSGIESIAPTTPDVARQTLSPSLGHGHGTTSSSSSSSPASSPAPHEQQSTPSPAAVAAVAGETPAEEAPLPPGWVKQYSRSKKRYYWFNTDTGKSLWEPPTV
jgi:hypothetical protein